jgi:2OG-Fe(II) oxygenase superfamily
LKLSYQTSEFAVFDDFLDRHSLQLVWNYIQSEDFSFMQVKRWSKVNRLLDGNSLLGPTTYSDHANNVPEDVVYPTGRGPDLVIEKILKSLAEFEPWTGKREDEWQYFTLRPYLYPQGVGLSWHDDYTKSTAQFVLYVHPYWNAHWGAELLVANVRDMPRPRVELYGASELAFVGPFLDNSDESDRLMELGVGHYVAPRPNRLILMAAGVQHTVKKVEPAAGDNVRASVTGFFINQSKVDRRFTA